MNGAWGKRHKKGRRQVLGSDKPQEVRTLAHSHQTRWQHVQVRHTEGGLLEADFAIFRVWTLTPNQAVPAEWLVIRPDADGDHT